MECIDECPNPLSGREAARADWSHWTGDGRRCATGGLGHSLNINFLIRGCHDNGRSTRCAPFESVGMRGVARGRLHGNARAFHR